MLETDKNHQIVSKIISNLLMTKIWSYLSNFKEIWVTSAIFYQNSCIPKDYNRTNLNVLMQDEVGNY